MTNGDDPVSDVICTAVVLEYNGNDHAMGYWSKLNGAPSKEILYGITADYTDEDSDPFNESNLSIVKTDTDGYAYFTHLRYSVWGESSKYKMQYLCDGVR